MKENVSDEAVQEYVERLRSGSPLGKVFPAKISECAFTDSQRELIRVARAQRKAKLKEMRSAAQPAKSADTNGTKSQASSSSFCESPKTRPLTKLRKMLYLQSGRCFFCGQPLSESEASIEHLVPRSQGGSSGIDNEVVCHSSLNETFGDMGVKEKIEFVLRSAGSFVCPKR